MGEGCAVCVHLDAGHATLGTDYNEKESLYRYSNCCESF